MQPSKIYLKVDATTMSKEVFFGVREENAQMVIATSKIKEIYEKNERAEGHI